MSPDMPHLPHVPHVPQPLPATHATPREVAMMARALELARDAGTQGEVPVGALVLRDADGVVLAEARNALEAAKDPLAHAETLTIRAAAKALGDWRLEGCTLLVTLEPCAMCAGAILQARIPRVVFGAMNPKAGHVGSLSNLLADPRSNHRPVVIAGLFAEESATLLKQFFRDVRSS
jgi:tRNA(adenine34) deaminase